MVDAADEAAAPRAGRRDVPPAARQPGDRGAHRRVIDSPSELRTGRRAGPERTDDGSASCCSRERTASSTSRHAVEQLGGDAEICFHADAHLRGVDAVVVPGGFAHGDYLRTGAIARFSPVMEAVAELAAAGGPVVGICNGFQVLCRGRAAAGRAPEERGSQVPVRDRSSSGWTAPRRSSPARRRVGRRPAHPDQPLRGQLRLRRRRRWPSSATSSGSCCATSHNPNGSLDDIAGICNEAGNVVGLMPHPERASDLCSAPTTGSCCSGRLLDAATERAALVAS